MSVSVAERVVKRVAKRVTMKWRVTVRWRIAMRRWVEVAVE
jgi:hypothetical protein